MPKQPRGELKERIAQTEQFLKKDLKCKNTFSESKNGAVIIRGRTDDGAKVSVVLIPPMEAD